MTSFHSVKLRCEVPNTNISRTIIVPLKTTFYKLHKHLQNLLGFQDYHMWTFTNERDTLPQFTIEPLFEDGENEDVDGEWFDAKKTKLHVFFQKFPDCTLLKYRYDYGDGWRCLCTVEKFLEKDCEASVIATSGWMLAEDIWWVRWRDELFEIFQKKNKKWAEDLWYDDWGHFQAVCLSLKRTPTFTNFKNSQWILKIIGRPRSFFVRSE